jgi:[ribosomal protein S5]-alanine N-acetyltransferase
MRGQLIRRITPEGVTLNMLETERLLFRKFTLGDLEWLHDLRSDKDVARYLGGIQPRDNVETRLRWYIDCYRLRGFGYCLMTYKPGGEAIGWAGLQPLEDTGEIEVGYGIAKAYWGLGIATEACKAWMEFGFDKLGLKRIAAIAIPENTASRRVMEKAGMSYEKNIEARGYECAFYAISKEEFETAK